MSNPPALLSNKSFRQTSFESSTSLKEKEPGDVAVADVSVDDLAPAVSETSRLVNVFWRKKGKTYDPDAIATRRSVYDDPALAQFYWPRANYENIHRFDPKARWTHKEEKAVIRKIDWRIMAWTAISFSALNIDRGNLSAANSDNFLVDLNMTTDDFNLGNSLFRIMFLVAELPSQLVSKRIGPDRWIPAQICLWSLVTLAQFWLSGRTSFLVCRSLLGLLQGGFIPDLVLYLSYFYTKTELPIRLSLFWVSNDLCDVIASFIAFGILHMEGIAEKPGWRWLFMVEGLLTLAIGVATFFMMPPSPTQTKTWYRPNGWFTEREETIMVTRVLRDDPSKGDMHNRQGITPKHLWTAICNYDLWPVYILGLMFGIPLSPVGTYLTLSLRELGFGTFQTNLLTIPSTLIGTLTLFLASLFSEFINDRTIASALEDLWALPFLIAIYCLPANPGPWLYYGLATALLSYPYTHPIQVGWCSRNAGSVASRTVNASLYNMFVQAAAVISANIYRADDAPRYRRGNRVLISVCLVNLCVLYPFAKVYYIWRNRQREKIWGAMTPEERKIYLETTTDVGNRRLDFRFAH